MPEPDDPQNTPYPSIDLDALSAAELDQLSFGAILVDASGTVLSYNAAESQLSGRSPAAVIGRDFFRDVAPCTHLPAFHGRFLDGVRANQLDERFSFVFGFDPRPVRVLVHMRNSRAPGRYWITVYVLGTVAPSWHRLASQDAQAAVDRRSRAEPVDPGVCEREPIHVPGAIQPHAVMLAADPATADLVVRACSDNVADAFGLDGTAVIGRPLEAVLPAELCRAIREALAPGEALDDPMHPLRRVVRLGDKAHLFAVAAHVHDGRLIVEIERTSEHPEEFGAATPFQAQDSVGRLRAAATLAEAARVAAREVRAMTGFERVLVYRFDADWNGEAIAEDKTPEWDHSLLGLRFPASDIPAQARALYTRSPGRFVVDRDAVSSAVLAEPQVANQSIDLSFAQARALSPVHLEYQRNLGVNGSMSLSILVEGKLWGLLIGHHRKPHYVTPETRALAGLVADALALRVHELESVRLWREQQATLAVQNRLLERMAGSDDFVAALTQDGADEPTLLDLVAASGAAVVGPDDVTPFGIVPPEPDIQALAAWLRGHLAIGTRVFATECLGEHFAPGERMREVASGLLAAFVDGEDSRDHLLLWFRPEVAATIVWGGDPNKPVLADASRRTVLPRRSFERWVEEKRGHADPWAPWQAGVAEALALAIEGVALRQGRRIAELTNKQAALTRALEQKDVLAREVDHRVKNSLQIVAGVMLMQARGASDPRAKVAFEDTYARVMSVARVHDSLHQSSDIAHVDLGQTLRQLCADLAAGMGGSHHLEVEAEPGLMVSSQTAVALALIATELVTNALKYAYAPGEGGGVEVTLAGRAGGGVALSVCDSGRGLPDDWQDRQGQGRAGGGGLGMKVIRAMLQQIKAEITVENKAATGVCFTVLT